MPGDAELTNWPVRLELEGTASQGRAHLEYVLEDFQWNVSLTAQDFACEIPDDFELIADLEHIAAAEGSAIRGLRAYAQLVGGRFPSTLSLATAIHEAEEVWENHRERTVDSGWSRERAQPQGPRARAQPEDPGPGRGHGNDDPVPRLDRGRLRRRALRRARVRAAAS